MSEILSKEMMLTLAATFIFYFTLGACGAFTKDLYDNLVNGRVKIELSRIFIAAISTAFICIGTQDYLSTHVSLNVIIFMGFLCGVVGFELFGYLNSLKGIRKTFGEIMSIKKCLDLGMSVAEIEQSVESKKTTSPSVQQEKLKESDRPSVVTEQDKSTNRDEHKTSHDETKESETNDLLSRVIEEHLE